MARRSASRFRTREGQQMRMPGFSAETSLYTSGHRYRRAPATGGAPRPQNVRAQLKGGGGFHRPGGGLGTIGDYWTCKDKCETAKWACLETCEGTLDNPKPSRNCLLCDDDYNACMRGCTSDIA